MTKKMCSWKREEIKENIDEFKRVVREPKYYCRKCGRVAKSEKYLCKPEKL